MKKLGRVGLVLGVLTLTGTLGCEGAPDPAKEHRIKATNHFNKKEFKQAAAEYELSLQADPNQEKSWKEKAFAHQQVGEHEKAGEALLKYVEFVKNPTEKTDLYRVAADEFRQAGKVEDAEKALLQVLATKGTNEEKSELYRVIADQYRQAGNLDQAEAKFNEALKLNPKDEASLGWLAAIYSKRGGTENAQATAVPEHLDKAIAYLDQVVALNPDYPFTYINKRIVMAKYIQYEQQQQTTLEAEARTNKNKAKSAEAMAQAAEHLKKAQEYQKQYEDLTNVFKEKQEKFKAKQAAEKAAKEAAQPPAPTPAPNK
ncbi:tetratricopeptide repeat protein [Hyalangium versicolor]|uniref:tetratricopeptide repeat protein n=1 Tax=Hyalangium versicolor TaxID=2861190 RepID=UPI001CCA8B53|nr:tetratricopeptide repeat protein [Hyalangium versicolor]